MIQMSTVQNYLPKDLPDNEQNRASGIAPIKSIYVLLPGLTDNRWQCGGLLVARKFARLLNEHVPSQLVTYVDREAGTPYLDDIDFTDPANVFIVTWAPHVNDLARRLQGRRLIYYAQSVIWQKQIKLPVTVPIICVSRYVMAQWTLKAPHNPLFLLGPVIEPDCHDNHIERDIDVLFIARKSTGYVLNHLVPALKERCNVYTLNKFVSRQDLFQLYSRSRVYLYSSDLTEGFGFQPLEALISGCVVFSDIHGGLSDYLEPEINAFKLGTYSLQYDLERILRVLTNGWAHSQSELTCLREEYSEVAFHKRMKRVLPALGEFFCHIESSPADMHHFAVEPKPFEWRLALSRAHKHAQQHWRLLLASK